MRSVKGKLLIQDEWVRSNVMSRKFCILGLCEIRQRETCGVVWHSVKTGRTRCTRCFNPLGTWGDFPLLTIHVGGR
jgi:hypothetical protein